ncbi:MAG: hypothetical protein CM15mV132_370 [uncultured marine virus]|nr:MAG: hypothetical protein CM15mV132_370 [uncultured marine virus]
MKELDLVAMKKGAKKLLGTKDFSTFRAFQVAGPKVQ